MKKKVSIVVLCVCLVVGVVGLSPSATAAELPPYMGIDPFWDNTASISLIMSFSNGRITSEGTVIGQNGTTGITASFTLSRQNANGTFTVVDTWSAVNNSTMTMFLSSSRTTANQTAGTYRLSITTRVTRNGTTETVSESHTMTLR